MKLSERIIELLEKMGIITKEKKEEVTKELAALDETPPTPAAKSDDPQVQALIEQNKRLLAALEAEKEAREKGAAELQKQMDAERKKKVDAAVKKAMDDKKITEAEKAHWEALLTKDYDVTEKLLSSLNVHPSLKGDEKKPTNGTKTDEADLPEGSLGEYVKNQAQHTKTVIEALTAARKTKN